jgi:hypothetical protein
VSRGGTAKESVRTLSALWSTIAGLFGRRLRRRQELLDVLEVEAARDGLGMVAAEALLANGQRPPQARNEITAPATNFSELGGAASSASTYELTPSQS